MSSEKESTSLVKGPSGVEMAEGPGDTHTQLGSNFVDARELQYRVHIPGGYANGKTSPRMMIWNHSIRAAVDAVVRVEMTDALRAVQYAIVMPWTTFVVPHFLYYLYNSVLARRRTFETQSSNIVPSFVYQQLTDDRILYM
ncbi:hypothetical protein FRB91_001474 [Serendipita sp. 411]|nr:hypothetical protein FRB91_001474 [Serendipita sp. 411]